MKNLPTWMTTVTPVSKIIAAILFISLPFAGFYLGTNLPKTVINTDRNLTSNTVNTNTLSLTASITPHISPTLVPTTAVTSPSHIPEIVSINFDGKFSPTSLNIYKNDIVLVNSDISCIQFSTDKDILGKLQDVGYTLIGKRTTNTPDGEGICANDIANPSQSFSLQYKDIGKHKLYSFTCLNTQCLSANEDVNSYVPLIINIK